MSATSTQVITCDAKGCKEETEADLPESTFGQVDVWYQTSGNDSGTETHHFCGKHYPKVHDGLVKLGLVSPPPKPPAE